MSATAFIETGSTKVSGKRAKKYHLQSELKGVSVGAILWYVFMRTVYPHRFKVAMAYIVYRTLLDIFPPLNDVLLGVIGSMV